MSEPRSGVTWHGLFGTLTPLVLGAIAGVWALFSLSRTEWKDALSSHASQEHPSAVSASEHDRVIRRLEIMETRVDSLWQRPTLATVEIDGQKVEGTVSGISDTGQEVFESDGLKATRTPGGVWRIIWRRKE